MARRDTRIDVAKGVLITLVVVGHALVGSMGESDVGHGTGWNAEPQRFILTTIYLAHMPLFVFFVGVTAKSDRLGKRIAKLMVLLISLHVAYCLTLQLITGEWPANAWVAPYWVLWFIAAMIWWLLILPLVERAPRTMLAASIAAVPLAGLLPIDGYILTIGRAITFLPFFIAGHLYGRRILDTIGSLRVIHRIGAAAALIALATTVWSLDIDRQWMFGSQTFQQMLISTSTGLQGRLAMLAVMVAASACLLCLILWRVNSPLEVAGRHSLAIFALHPIALLAYQRLPEPWGPDSFSAPTQAAIAVVFALLVVALLALPVFDRALRTYSDRVVGMFTRSRAESREDVSAANRLS